jgi:hypothetical protein
MATKEFDLLDELRSLSDVANALEQAVHSSSPDLSHTFKNLQATVLGLGQAKAARSLHCPEEYVSRWKTHIQNQNGQLEGRAVRYLCWEPQVATSQRFQYYLDQERIDLNARALQGLVRCCHAQWSPDFAKSHAVRRICDRLEKYSGPNRLLCRWRDNSTIILGPKGAEAFGAEMVQKLQNVKQYCATWGLGDETSLYVQAAVRHASKVCRSQMDRVPKLRDYLFDEIFPWNGWASESFKMEVSETILDSLTTQSADVQECVRRFILDDPRLGDPRRAKENRLKWIDIREAETRVIEWLSQLDIKFFFDSVLPKGQDPHGRKQFWLKYVSAIKKSRPLLRREDKERLHRDLKEKGLKLVDAGAMDEWSTASAFLLDFGTLLVIEFSETGNACYVYRRNDVENVIADFWTPRPFRQQKLKRQELAVDRIVHRKQKNPWHSGGWEDSAARLLASFDIRPGRKQCTGQ